eukprot:6184018-Pleurochrysis_carterae.AAC.1
MNARLSLSSNDGMDNANTTRMSHNSHHDRSHTTEDSPLMTMATRRVSVLRSVEHVLAALLSTMSACGSTGLLLSDRKRAIALICVLSGKM